MHAKAPLPMIIVSNSTGFMSPLLCCFVQPETLERRVFKFRQTHLLFVLQKPIHYEPFLADVDPIGQAKSLGRGAATPVNVRGATRVDCLAESGIRLRAKMLEAQDKLARWSSL